MLSLLGKSSPLLVKARYILWPTMVSCMRIEIKYLKTLIKTSLVSERQEEKIGMLLMLGFCILTWALFVHGHRSLPPTVVPTVPVTVGEDRYNREMVSDGSDRVLVLTMLSPTGTMAYDAGRYRGRNSE